MSTEDQKGRIMPREDFNLMKFKRTKEGVSITHHVGGTNPANINADVDVQPHPDLQKKMDELQLYMATRLGLLQGWDFAREGTRKDSDLLEKAIQGHKDAVAMCNINGISFVGEGETAGVMITGSIKTPKSGSVGLAVPKISFGKEVLGYENEVEQICEEITDEIYSYLILKKKEQTDLGDQAEGFDNQGSMEFDENKEDEAKK